jgi:N-acetylglucosamine-6-phosphate deacetylase
MHTLVIDAPRLLTPLEQYDEARIIITGEHIAAAGPRAAIPPPAAAELYNAPAMSLAPALLDLHIHGAGGHDVMEATPEALAAITQAVARHGTAAILATTVTASPDATCRSLEGIAGYIRSAANTAAGRARILGIHLEGPFISHGRRGVHPSEYIAEPSAKLFERFYEAAQGHLRILTLAPELPGAAELMDAARQRGVLLSMGHTDATYEQARAAIDRGARHATHVFNAMRPFSHRDAGVLGAILTDARITAELIADGIHVDDPAIRLLIASKGAEKIILVTDATSATGMPDGHYRLGNFEVLVEGGVCRDAEGRLAGSTLTLDRAVRHMIATDVGLAEALRMATIQPARVLSLDSKMGVLIPGAEASLILLDGDAAVSRVMLRGEWVT